MTGQDADLVTRSKLSPAKHPHSPLSQLIIGGSGPDTIIGTEHDDDLEGRQGDDILWGRNGNDILVGEEGSDQLYGEAGGDILEGGVGNDLLDGGEGFDLATYILSTSGVSVDMNLAGPQNTGSGYDTLVNVEGLYGSDHNDSLIGDAAANLLAGLDGADVLLGGDANDELNGGLGNDDLDGGDGDDLLIGGLGNDTLRGGAGFDVAYFYGGSPVTVDLRISGSQNTRQGFDTLVDIEDVVGTQDNDVLNGNEQANVLNGDRGSDRIFGHGGDDILVAATQINQAAEFDGGDGYDVLYVPDSAHLSGSTSRGVEALLGKWVTIGSSVLGDLKTIDVETLQTGGPNILDLRAIDLIAGKIIVSGAGVNLTGTARGHTFEGSGSNNRLMAGDGDDIVRALEGDDLLEGAGGDDRMEGGNGADTLYGGAGADVLAGDRNDDLLFGGDGDDNISGGHGNDTIYGGDGADLLGDAEGTNVLYGEGGDDRFYVSFDIINVTIGSSTYYGGAGNDTFFITRGLYGTFSNAHVYDGGEGIDRVEFELELHHGDPPADLTLFDFRNIEIIKADSARVTMEQLRTFVIEAPIISISDASGVINFRDVTYIPTQITIETPAVLDLSGLSYPSPPYMARQLTGSWGDDVIRTGLSGAVVYAGQGNDAVYAAGSGGRYYGEDGNDYIDGGSGLEGARFEGGDGDDVLIGNSGDDWMIGGAGNDRLVGGSGGEDVAIFLHAFADYTLTANADGTVTVSRQGETDTISGFEELGFSDGLRVFFVGDDADDHLEFYENHGLSWYFDGRGGDDYFRPTSWGEATAFGGAGDDILLGARGIATHARYYDGGEGNDQLSGGNADDILTGGDGQDVLTSGNGNDDLSGGYGQDSLTGEAGDDTLWGGAGDDVMSGGDGYDTAVIAGLASDAAFEWTRMDYRGTEFRLASVDGRDSLLNVEALQFEDRTVELRVSNQEGGSAAETLSGGGYIDIIDGNGGNDVLNGGAGWDQLLGGTGNDTLNGGADNDILQGNAGDDALNGGGGDDVIIDIEGFNLVDGGSGVDTIRFSRAASDYAITANADGTHTIRYSPSSGISTGTFRTTARNVELVAFSDRTVLLTAGLNGTGDADQMEGTAASEAISGADGDDRLSGLGGADVLVGGLGADWMDGGNGPDRFVINSVSESLASNPDFIAGFETGLDYIDLSGAQVGDVLLTWTGVETIISFAPDGEGYRGMIRVAGGVSARDIIAAGAPIHLAASQDADVIWGGSYADSLEGAAGDDLIYGEAGDDEIDGGSGNDEIYGGMGSDWISGGDGDDRIDTGDGDDHVFGGLGDDVITAFWGTNKIDGGSGIDTAVFRESRGSYQIVDLGRGVFRIGTNQLSGVEFAKFEGSVVRLIPEGYVHGGEQADDLVGSALGDQIFGYEGDDVLAGLDGTDQMFGDIGNDVIDGGAGDDALDGAAGNDTLSGGLGNDGLTGGAGQDSLNGNDGADILDGGADDDTLIGGQGDDVLNGGAGLDNLVGAVGVDILRGDEGDDVLNGGAGDDDLSGGAGADTLIGGGGIDTARYSDATSGVKVYLNTGTGGAWAAGDTFSGIENVIGSNHADLLVGDGANNSLHGGGGADEVKGGAGNDQLLGAAGDDVLEGGDGNDNLAGGDNRDTLQGDAGDDVLNGGSGVDKLFAGAGADHLIGGADNDKLNGGSDNDILDGGQGNDILTGGSGDDLFVFRGASGSDTITDFRAGAGLRDVISFSTSLFVNLADVKAHTTNDGLGNCVISKNGVVITLAGVTINQLVADDFEFVAAAPADLPGKTLEPLTLPGLDPLDPLILPTGLDSKATPEEAPLVLPGSETLVAEVSGQAFGHRPAFSRDDIDIRDYAWVV